MPGSCPGSLRHVAPGAGTPTFGPIKDIPAGGSPERWKRAAPQRAALRARPPAPILQQHSSRPHSCSHRGYDLGELSPGRDARSSHGGVGHTEGCPLKHLWSPFPSRRSHHQWHGAALPPARDGSPRLPPWSPKDKAWAGARTPKATGRGGHRDWRASLYGAGESGRGTLHRR